MSRPSGLLASPSPTSASSGCSRWVIYVGIAGVVLMVFFLLSSSMVIERGMNMVVVRARQRVLDELPQQLTSKNRMRTTRNLDRLLLQLERGSESGPFLGEFLNLVATAFDNEQLSVDEVEEINLFLEARFFPSTAEGKPTPLLEATEDVPPAALSPTPAPRSEAAEAPGGAG